MRRSCILAARWRSTARPVSSRRFRARERSRCDGRDSPDGRLLAESIGRDCAASPGDALADALSFFPGLANPPRVPAEDAAALRRLADGAGRYSPWTAPDGGGRGGAIEIHRLRHLWGGERALAADLIARLDHRHVSGRIAIARHIGRRLGNRPLCRNGQGPRICRREIVRLPLARCRGGSPLDPVTAQVSAGRLEADRRSLRNARDALARRFGETIARRLDQGVGTICPNRCRHWARCRPGGYG